MANFMRQNSYELKAIICTRSKTLHVYDIIKDAHFINASYNLL